MMPMLLAISSTHGTCRSNDSHKHHPTAADCRQEIKGDDTPVLQSVLQADREREWLLKVEQETMRPCGIWITWFRVHLRLGGQGRPGAARWFFQFRFSTPEFLGD